MDASEALAAQLRERAELFPVENTVSRSEENTNIQNQACTLQSHPGYELFLPASPKVKRDMFRHYAEAFGTQHWSAIRNDK